MVRCGAVQSRLRVSSRRLSHSDADGKNRFSLRTPQGGSFFQTQLGPPAPRLPLLSRQPFPQRPHQVVVRELVMTRSAPPTTRHPFRSCRRDQTHLAVEDAQQALEVADAAPVARERQQLGLRAHVPLDVFAGFGQERLSTALAAFS